MKKFLIVCVALAMLVSVFAVSASAEDTREFNESDVIWENVGSLSAIIKILRDNGYDVSVTAPYESATGLIQISPAISAGTVLSSDITVQDLIPGYPFGIVYNVGTKDGDLKEQREDVDYHRYYMCHFNVRAELREEDPSVTIYAGNVCFGGSDFQDCDGVELQDPDAVISLHFDCACTSIDEFTVVRSEDYDESYSGSWPSTWLPSVDYRTGYTYTVEEPATEPTVSGGSAATADDAKPLSLIPKQADLPKVWLLIRVAVIGIAGTAVLVVLFKIFRPKMRMRRR